MIELTASGVATIGRIGDHWPQCGGVRDVAVHTYTTSPYAQYGMRRREPPQRYLPDEEATRPQHGGTRHITVADLKLATRSLAARTGAAAFREMSLRELRQELTAHLRMPLDALEEHRFAIRSIAVSLSAELYPCK